jgi:NAD(P)-dependent dehydrogenase (short-subunit alcohol dehydrogenase family)
MVLDRFSLAGRVGIVTGAGQGLGRVFALSFAEAGADVVIAENNPETAERTAAEVRALGRRSVAIVTDVRKRESVRAMMASAVAQLGRLDFFMNNAGITKWGAAAEVSEADWREVLDVNLNGVFFCAQEAARCMMKTGGSIINIASMSGVIVNRPQEQASYNTSKAAVIHLTRSLAAEWAPHRIRVNAISPGYMDTTMARPFFEDPKYGGVWMDATPMGRPGKPEELGPLAVFLASDASSFVTGANIVIDGGYSVW